VTRTFHPKSKGSRLQKIGDRGLERSVDLKRKESQNEKGGKKEGGENLGRETKLKKP